MGRFKIILTIIFIFALGTIISVFSFQNFKTPIDNFLLQNQSSILSNFVKILQSDNIVDQTQQVNNLVAENLNSLTVKENIALGNINKKVEDDSINQSAQKADAIEFIDEFEYKFDQILMPNVKKGTKPSTGQWQKLAIARFFYRNSPIVIFDEPTSSIDAISEYEIFNKFYDFFTDKTVILISHKFSTVKNADKIIVLQKGRIVEVGTHKELLKNNGKKSCHQ